MFDGNAGCRSAAADLETETGTDFDLACGAAASDLKVDVRLERDAGNGGAEHERAAGVCALRIRVGRDRQIEDRAVRRGDAGGGSARADCEATAGCDRAPCCRAAGENPEPAVILDRGVGRDAAAGNVEAASGMEFPGKRAAESLDFFIVPR